MNKLFYISVAWACSAAGSALHSHCRGRRFESDQVHQKDKIRTSSQSGTGSDLFFT